MHDTSSPPPISVCDLSVVLGGASILDGVSLDVPAGQSLALLGSGPAAAGTARLFGANVAERRSVPWRRIGYVPQRVTASAGVPATALEVVRS